LRTTGRFPFDQNFRKRDKWYGEFQGKVAEKPEIVEIAGKANHSTENSGNSEMKIKWNGNFRENMFKNMGILHEVVLFFENYTNSLFSIQR